MTPSPPNMKPLDSATLSARLGSAGGRFLDSAVGNSPVYFVQKSRTKVDVGSWLLKRPVWVCLLQRELLLFASGSKPFVERIPLEDLHQSQYNHVTGEVVLAPAASAGVSRLKIPPLEALEVLSHICPGE